MDTITYNQTGNATSFSGPKAVDLFRCAALLSSLNLFKAGMRFKNCSGTQALAQASQYTGKKYKRGQYDEARADLRAVLDAKKADESIVHEVRS